MCGDFRSFIMIKRLHTHTHAIIIPFCSPHRSQLRSNHSTFPDSSSSVVHPASRRVFIPWLVGWLVCCLSLISITTQWPRLPSIPSMCEHPHTQSPGLWHVTRRSSRPLFIIPLSAGSARVGAVCSLSLFLSGSSSRGRMASSLRFILASRTLSLGAVCRPYHC